MREGARRPSRSSPTVDAIARARVDDSGPSRNSEAPTDYARPVNRLFWSNVASWTVVRIAARTSLVVGTLLNVVNQWGEIFEQEGAIHWLRFALNYLVPYAVASYGAASMARRPDPPPIEGE